MTAKDTWLYYGEYNLHMYGWKVFKGSYTGKKGDGFFSDLAYSASNADIVLGELDNKWEVATGTIIIGLLGV